jgi:hypothetical protein
MLLKYKQLTKLKQDYNQSVTKFLEGTGSILSATDDQARLNVINRLAKQFNQEKFFWQRPLKELRVFSY